MSRTPVRSENPPLPNLEEGGFVWLLLRLVIAAAATATVIVVALLVPAVLGRLVLLLLCLLVLAILALLLLTVLALILLGHGVLRFSAHRTALMVLRVRQKNRQPAAEICRVE